MHTHMEELLLYTQCTAVSKVSSTIQYRLKKLPNICCASLSRYIQQYTVCMCIAGMTGHAHIVKFHKRMQAKLAEIQLCINLVIYNKGTVILTVLRDVTVLLQLNAALFLDVRTLCKYINVLFWCFMFPSHSSEEVQLGLVSRFVNESVFCLQEGILSSPVDGTYMQEQSLASGSFLSASLRTHRGVCHLLVTVGSVLTHKIPYYTKEKSFSETSFTLRMELNKGQKQGRDERTQEDYPTSAKNTQQMQSSLLASFISALFQAHP